MFSSSSIAQTSSRQGGQGKSYIPQVPKGFTVRVFKGPSVYSLHQGTTSQSEHGYHDQSIPSTNSRQNTINNSQNWYARAQTPLNPAPAPSEQRNATSRPSTSSGNSSHESRLSRYDPNSRSTNASYSIYQSSKDVYVYEASLSSKGDLASNSEDDGAIAEYTPSSAFSPAMSTDSIMTVRAAAPDASLTDLRISTPTPTQPSSRIPFPLYIPSLSQAQTAIKGMFRTQSTQNDSGQSHAPTTLIPHAGSTPSTSSTRSGTPFVPSDPASGSADLGANIAPQPGHIAGFNSARSSYLEPRSSASYDGDESELENIARANAQYNAAASRAGSTTTYYSSARDSMYLPPATPAAQGSSAGEATRAVQLYPNLPLRSSPEEYHAQATTSQRENRPSYWTAPDMSRRPSVGTGQQSQPINRHASSNSASTQSIRSEQTAGSGPSRGRSGSQSTPRLPTAEQAATGQIPPVSLSNAPQPPNRYVPASRTLPSSGRAEPVNNRESHDVIGSKPYSSAVTQAPRERRTSMSRPSPPSITAQASVSRGEVSGAGTSRMGMSWEDMRRSSAEQQPAYAPHHANVTSTSRDPPSARTSPHQTHNAPPDRPPTTQPSSGTIPIYASNTGASGSSREQSWSQRELPPQPHSAPTRQIYDQPPGERRSNYVSSAATQSNTSPPRARRDSLAPSRNGVPRPSASAMHATSSTQGGHLQDPRADPPYGQSSYGPRNSGVQDAQNQRSGEYGSHSEADRQLRGNLTAYLPTQSNEAQIDPVSNTRAQSSFHPSEAPKNRPRYEIESRRTPDHFPRFAYVPPPSTSSDPGPETAYGIANSYLVREPSSSQHPSAIAGRTGLHATSSRDDRQLPVAGPSDPSMNQFPAPLRDPQRRYSDADSSAASHSTYGPAYASYMANDGPASDTTETPRPPETQPQRRYSDGDQTNPAAAQSLTLFRTVRWNENLVCPSPIFAHQRRKGWFNRRGDQLWTNDGAYKPPTSGQEYPPDLDNYPDHGEGWMNESGTRIDMAHRLIPKPPLKSALKQPRRQLQDATA